MKRIILYVFLICCPAYSCRTGGGSLMPGTTGKPGEILLVMNNELWSSPAGDSLRVIFEKPFDLLPQLEPSFDLIHISFSSFKNFFQLYRNIVFVEVSSQYKQPKMIVQNNVYAQPQLVVHLQVSSDSMLTRIIENKRNKLFSLFEEAERQRLINTNMLSADNELVQRINHKHHVSIIIPKGYRVAIDTSGFTWLVQETGSIIQGIVIYDYPFKDSGDFSMQMLLAARDKFMKNYVQGDYQGSFMTTEKMFMPLKLDYFLRGKRQVTELRGLWKIKNGISMGGPFVSVSTLDKKNNRVVTLEGFVYAAGFKKRNYLRQQEAIILSLDLVK